MSSLTQSSRFEAAWKGDIETIKSYTLGPWGPGQSQSPLTVSVKDEANNSVFSLAVGRGHHDVAREVLEIVAAQYEPDEADKLAYKIKGARIRTDFDDDGDQSCEDEDYNDDDDDIKIVSHSVGEKKFTIDNIGEMDVKVRCKTRPIDVLTSSYPWLEIPPFKQRLGGSLFTWAIRCKDQQLVNLLIDLGIRYMKPEYGVLEEDSFFAIPTDAFERAVSHGPVPILADIIRRTGGRIPLDHLVKRTGVEVREKPKFYQGLTVYGKKRKDWANAGRKLVVRDIESKIPPVLTAAMSANMELVKWFLSDEPQRLYVEIANAKLAQGDKRFKHLAELPGGLERAISKWLSVQGKQSEIRAVQTPMNF